MVCSFSVLMSFVMHKRPVLSEKRLLLADKCRKNLAMKFFQSLCIIVHKKNTRWRCYQGQKHAFIYRWPVYLSLCNGSPAYFMAPHGPQCKRAVCSVCIKSLGPQIYTPIRLTLGFSSSIIMTLGIFDEVVQWCSSSCINICEQILRKDAVTSSVSPHFTPFHSDKYSDACSLSIHFLQHFSFHFPFHSFW